MVMIIVMVSDEDVEVVPAGCQYGGHEVDVGHHLLVPLRPQHRLYCLRCEQLEGSTLILNNLFAIILSLSITTYEH